MDNTFKDLRLPAKQAWQDKEQKLQFECARWLKKYLYERGLPQLFYHPQNEGMHKPQYRAKMKSQGVLAGVSDVVLPIRNEDFSGVYCELKRAGGTVSPEQKAFLDGVAAQGYLAVLINDLDTFKEVFVAYLLDVC
jgi:hypothetical protein